MSAPLPLPLPLLVTACACAVLWQGGCRAAEGGYTVPEPYIQALRPTGVRFSIPDEPGLELFAVHANINKEMRDLEAGQLSRDVLKPRGGRWVFEDLQVALRPGDRLNYWLYVKRHGLGLRRDNGSFTVTELVDRNTPATPPVASSQHCPQGCGDDALTQQRLRHAEELHQQRLRHAEELHRERLHQLQQQKQPPGRVGAGDAADPQDVSAFKRIGSRR